MEGSNNCESLIIKTLNFYPYLRYSLGKEKTRECNLPIKAIVATILFLFPFASPIPYLIPPTEPDSTGVRLE